MQTEYSDSFNTGGNSNDMLDSAPGVVDYNPNSPTKSKSPTPTKEDAR